MSSKEIEFKNVKKAFNAKLVEMIESCRTIDDDKILPYMKISIEMEKLDFIDAVKQTQDEMRKVLKDLEETLEEND